MAFIVDNGPGEAPSSPLVKMLLARLLNYLNLDVISQMSFAEYNSKLNYVERVHAVENDCISRHGPFSSKLKHAECEIGDIKHRENMEEMCKQVIDCIGQGGYSGHPLTCVRGVRDEEFVFNDEERLRQFLMLSEEGKELCDWTYKPEECPLATHMKILWKANDCERRYIDDYNLLTKLNTPNTNWSDQYSCILYRENDMEQNQAISRHPPQPIPDFVRWVETEELHYLSISKAQEINEIIPVLTQTPELFLPSRILDAVLRIMLEVPSEVLVSLALLEWVPLDDLKEFIAEKKSKQEKLINEGLELERVRRHPLYKVKKVQLVEKCKAEKIKHQFKKKHELVKALMKEEAPPYQPIKLEGLPSTLYQITTKVPVSDLRFILHQNGLSTIGTKDELALRCYLKKNNKDDFISKDEVSSVMKVIKIAKEVILEQKRMSILGFQDEITKRKNSSEVTRSKIQRPEDTNFETLADIFSPLETFIKSSTDPKTRDIGDADAIMDDIEDGETGQLDNYECFFQIGAKVKVFWKKEDVQVLGWRGGWYVAYVTDFCREEDQISVQHVSERDSIYDLEVTSSLSDNQLKLA
ncbi:uncharacterized protein [Clytia hemisphaerica]|uniref:uncharacterized protein n=1 Tax=Clytia hemisphaerica TaxID=252671 RepID=UPI0034D5555D